MSAKILLVDLDKDYIRRVENNSEFRLRIQSDLFQEALQNLQDDVQGWGAGSGIELTLEAVTEVEKEPVESGVITRTYTRVYAQTERDDDMAWISLSLGQIKPAKKLSHGQIRGWQFDWSPS